MKDGLNKATEKWKEVSKERQVIFVCPYCGKTKKLPKWVAKNKTACSKECKKIHGGFVETAKKASEIAAKVAHEKNLLKKQEMSKDILQWSEANKEVIISCKYNNITVGLSDLINFINEKYGVKDLRSMFLCFNVKNKKELLAYLKDYVSSENIC